MPNGSAAGNTPYCNGTAWVTNSSNIFNNGGNVRIRNASPSGLLHVGDGLPLGANSWVYIQGNVLANRRIVMWENANNDHQYYGLGINANMFRFQVDDSSATYAFFAGANTTTSTELMRIQGNGNVGIRTVTPTSKLHVVGTSGTTLKIVDGNQAAGKVLTSDATGNASWVSPANTLTYNSTTNDLNISNRNTISLNRNCAFHSLQANNIAVAAGNVLIPFDTEQFDLGGNFNLATGTFTAPAAGVYQFNTGIYKYEAANTRGTIQVFKNGAFDHSQHYWFTSANNNNNVRNGSFLLQLNAGDVIQIYASSSAATTVIGSVGNPRCFFSGFRVQ